MNRLINLSRALPTPDPALTFAYTAIRLGIPGRQPLELCLTAAAIGNGAPIVILSHSYGPSKFISSKDDYVPFAQFCAERGSPSFSRPTPVHDAVDLTPTCPAARTSGASVAEMRAILDQLPALERQVPAIAGRLDHDRISVAGRSFGGQTFSLLLGGACGVRRTAIRASASASPGPWRRRPQA